MLRTRLWMGSLLILLAIGMLAFDQCLAPWYPFLFVFHLSLALAACRELLGLFGPARPTQKGLAYLGVLILVLANWAIPWLHRPGQEREILLLVFTFLGLASFLWEMRIFQEPGLSVERIARTLFVLFYLGLLPCFFAQLRWLYPPGSALGTAALALAIFVPKGCDIGAYFTGRLLGRHRMTPVLSPKKTWEGAIGGLALAVVVAGLLDRLSPEPVLRGSWLLAVLFGLSVGLTGMLGDLAESLIKRDCLQKDASQVVPGFGGVLDVVDAVIFAAPIVFVWCYVLR